MARFRGYAQENRRGFDPMRLPDESRRILEQAEQTIQGMKAVRDADIANTVQYLQGYNQAQDFEQATRTRAGQQQTENQQALAAMAQMRLEEKQEREKQRVAKTAKQREAILGVLSTLSKAAVAYIDEQAEEKVKDDYHRENHKLMLGDVSTELQQKIIADVGNHHALDIHEVGVNSLANASEANGASPLDTARLRQTGKGLSTGAYRARMEVAAMRYTDLLSRALSGEEKIKVQLYSPDGKGTIDGFAHEAVSARDIAFVGHQLKVYHLAKNGLWGKPTEARTKAHIVMQRALDKFVKGARSNEVQKQLDTKIDNLEIAFTTNVHANPVQAFHRAFDVGYGVLGGHRKAREHLYEMLKDNGSFTDAQVEAIFNSPFQHQPKPMRELYKSEVREVINARKKSYVTQYTNETNLRKTNIARQLDEFTKTMVYDVNEDNDQVLDLDDTQLEEMIQNFRRQGPEYSEFVQVAESFKDYTTTSVNESVWTNQYDERIPLGLLDPIEVQMNRNLSKATKKKYRIAAAKSWAQKPNEKLESEAKSRINQMLSARVGFIEGKTVKEQSFYAAYDHAIRQYHADFLMHREDGKSVQQAHDQALKVDFMAEMEKGPYEGEYALLTAAKSKDANGLFISGRFKNYEQFKIAGDSIEITGQQIQNTINSGNWSIDSGDPITNKDEISRSINSFLRGGKVNRVPQIMAMQKASSSQYSYIDLLNSEARKHGLQEIDVGQVNAIKKADLPVPTRYQQYKNPMIASPIRTDIMLMGSGKKPLYQQRTAIHRQVLNILGKYESDAAGGYDAMNEGGADGGRTPLGYSGPSQDNPRIGKAISKMTVRELMEHHAAGRIHAAGRYQFIGTTFAEEVRRQGINPEQVFNEELQDTMALNYFLYAGWEGIWIGPTDRATPYERQLLNIGRNNPYSTNPFDGLENRNPKLIERQLR